MKPLSGLTHAMVEAVFPERGFVTWNHPVNWHSKNGNGMMLISDERLTVDYTFGTMPVKSDYHK